MSTTVNDLLEAVKSWPSGKSLSLVLILFSVSTLTILASKGIVVTVSVFLPFTLVTICAWVWCRRLRKCPADKVGFILAINCEDSSLDAKLRRDFIGRLREQLSQSEFGQLFWLYPIPRYPERTICTKDEADRLRIKTRARFLLYGQVRSRGKEGERTHFFDLKGLVAPGKINEHNKQKLSEEFKELMPNRIKIPEHQELQEFEASSDIVFYVSRYIIGVVAECIGDLDNAERCFIEIQQQTQKSAIPKTSQVEKIIQWLPSRLSEISTARANISYNRWKTTREIDDLVEMSELLSRTTHDFRKRSPQWNTLFAIQSVALDWDLNAAREHLKRCGYEDAVTKMNLALISALERDLKKATQLYRQAEKQRVPLDTVEEVLDFQDWLQNERQDNKVELEYCKGFIAYCILKDFFLAKKHFVAFMRDADRSLYDREIDLIKSWLKELFIDSDVK